MYFILGFINYYNENSLENKLVADNTHILT